MSCLSKIACVLLLLLAPFTLRAAGTLELYFIDVEGGQSTLMVSPTGESLLVDTGWIDVDGRDARRIAAAVQKAGLKGGVDHLVITHYHADHVGGMGDLARLVKFRTVYTHGPNTETNKGALTMNATYRDAIAATGAREVVVKPGDVIPIKGFGVKVMASNRALIPPAANLQANPLCSGATQARRDGSDNSASVGMLVTFGRFRFLDLGDLTQDLEYEMACPGNRVGEVDLFLTTHHGSGLSNAQVFVRSLKSRVAIMNNGARKGGDPPVLQTVRSAPGLEDLWMLHYSVAGGDQGNVAERLIANLNDPSAGGADEGFGIRVSADETGAFTVTNERNNETKRYAARSK